MAASLLEWYAQSGNGAGLLHFLTEVVEAGIIEFRATKVRKLSQTSPLESAKAAPAPAVGNRVHNRTSGEITQRILFLRRTVGLSVEQICQRTGLSKSRVGSIISNFNEHEEHLHASLPHHKHGPSIALPGSTPFAAKPEAS